jgi:tetratricopeptide (TPR) repeat protein
VGVIDDVRIFSVPYFRVVLVALILNAHAPGWAADGAAAARIDATTPSIPVRAVPEWVRDRTIPEATSARLERAQDGVFYLLSDQQYRIWQDGHDYWFRTTVKVTNRSGLESAGQISLSYDPSFENIDLNSVRIIRNGKAIDLTGETRFRVVEHEDELSDGIVSGRLKAIANLRDVRVGDIVDYAATVHTRTRLWPGHAFFHFSQRYSDALALRAIRLVWPPAFTAREKTINSDVVFNKRKVGGDTEWEWSAFDIPAMRAEDDVPYTAFQWGRIDISTMKDWADLANWAVGLYKGDETLPPEFAARVDAIARTYSTPGERLTEITRYIQDNIRYVGEEMGEGSYVPRRPATVLSRGYGDCKDKSLLLTVALRRLGIDAVPALVATKAGERLPDRLPSPLEFDHVIVRANLDGHIIWIDATGSHRGGRGTAIVPSDLGYALPIRSGQAVLEKMEGFVERAGRVTVLEQFTVDEDAATPLTLHVETRYTGARADMQRANWAVNPPKKIAQANLDFYRLRFPALLESKPLELQDDRDGNTLVMIENYAMSREAFATAKIPAKLITRAYLLQNSLPRRQANPRVQPLGVSDHVINEQVIDLVVKNRVLEGMEDIDASAGAIRFSRKTTPLGGGLHMVYKLDTGTRSSIPANEADSVYALSDKIGDATGIEFYLDKSPHVAPGPEGIDASTWSLIKPDMEKINALLQKNDAAARIEALSLISTVSGRVPHPSPAAGLIDGLKGAILAELNRPQAALAALQSATTQYDGNAQVYRLWIAYELDLGTLQSVVKALQHTLKAQPKVLTALDERWVRAMMQKSQDLAPEQRELVRDDICIALAEAGWQLTPRTDYGDYILGCAIIAHSRRGDVSEARANLAREPSTDTLVALAMDRRHQALWPEIDRIGSDGFRKSLERDAARASTAAKATPKDYVAVTRYMKALRALGRFQEAVDAGKALAADSTQIEIVGEDGFWLVNEYAYDLLALGKADAAAAAFDPILKFGIDKYPSLVSMVLNRAGIVVKTGHFKDGLDSLTALEAMPAGYLSPYGRMVLLSNKACALRGLGRAVEAATVEAALSAKADDNWSAATAAAACRNDVNAIADMLVTRLNRADTRADALSLFIQFGAPEAHAPTASAMRQAMAKARAMPAVQATFAKVGRVVRYAGTTQGWPEF